MRLKTEYLDMLLLHRPDPLVEPEEVAEAFENLNQNGKVRGFGVSNHTPAQMELLLKFLTVPIRSNQIEFHLLHSGMLDGGIAGSPNPVDPSGLEGTIEFLQNSPNPNPSLVTDFQRVFVGKKLSGKRWETEGANP